MRYLICPLFAYVLAAPLTARISLDLTQTDWTHLATYFWWAFGWLIWGGIFILLGGFAASKD